MTTRPTITELELVRFFELSLDLFGIANLDGYFLRINSNFSKLLGYDDNDLLTRPFLDFVHPEDHAATTAAMGKLSSGLPLVQFRNRYRDVRGEFHWLEWTARSNPDSGLIYAVARDITEARLAEAQRIARVGSWEWRLESNHIWWSDEYFRILGLRPGEAPAGLETFYKRAHPDDAAMIRTWTQTTFDTGVPQSFDFRIIRPDGEERVLWTEARLERTPDGKPLRLLGTSQDITERRRAIEEKQLLERRLQETQRLESLGVLAGGIAHDFNNLLTAILGNASWIQSKLPASSPLRAALDNILNASERAALLCRQMLAYSGRGKLVLSSIDLNGTIVELVDLVKPSMGSKVVLDLDLANELTAVTADAAQLSQVIMNLVINAFEAIGDRPGRIAISTEIRHVDGVTSEHVPADLAAGIYVVTEVIDSGSGMDEATRQKIFEPFFTTKFTGRGLGLSAVLGIVRGHGGAIQVESEPGKGSTFRLFLPAVPSALGPAPKAASRTETATSWKGEGAVLVVDDEDLVRDTVGRILRMTGLRVVEAVDGEDALTKFRASPDGFSVVLLDLTMPKLDGEEVFRTLSALRPKLPVILMSGYNKQEAGARFAGMGLAGFLPKPFQHDDLIKCIRAAIESTV